jgi:alpha-D-ribose 1-methylphosphonate 5-triphosphate synthase subunit PhnH
MFALGTWEALSPLSSYLIGTSEYPDRSATLIVECPDIAFTGATLKGPGIKDSATLALPDMEAFQQQPYSVPAWSGFHLHQREPDRGAPKRSTEVF